MQYIINGFIEGSYLALVALSFLLIYESSRFFNFAHGSIVVIGPYATYTLMSVAGLSLIPSVAISVLFCGFVGVLLEASIFGPMRRNNATSLVLLIISLGIFIVIENGISLIFGDAVKSIRVGETKIGMSLFGARITNAQAWAIAITAFSFLVVVALLRNTKLGKAHRAVADDPELALISGVNSRLIILWSFFVGSSLGGLAGILIALDVDMVPTMGFRVLLRGIVAMIVGGVGSVAGAAMGGYFVGFARSLSVWQINSEWQDAIVFGILLLFLLMRPQGFLGKPVWRTTS